MSSESSLLWIHEMTGPKRKIRVGFGSVKYLIDRDGVLRLRENKFQRIGAANRWADSKTDFRVFGRVSRKPRGAARASQFSKGLPIKIINRVPLPVVVQFCFPTNKTRSGMEHSMALFLTSTDNDQYLLKEAVSARDDSLLISRNWFTSKSYRIWRIHWLTGPVQQESIKSQKVSLEEETVFTGR
jgi:hypothetical protein